MNDTQEEINSILDKYKSEDPEWEEMSRPYTMEQMNNDKCGWTKCPRLCNH